MQRPGKKNRVRTDAEKEQAAKDYYASVRTHVLLAWVLSNVSLYAYGVGSAASRACLIGLTVVSDFGRCFGIEHLRSGCRDQPDEGVFGFHSFIHGDYEFGGMSPFPSYRFTTEWII